MNEVLDCLPCCKTANGKHIDCIEQALEKIKEHYLFFRKEAEKKQKQIVFLQERNEKLEEAVEILQKEQVNLKKYCDTNKVKADDCKSQICDENSFNSSEASPIGSSDLNMAIHSDNLLDASSLSYNSTQNETIAETESLGYSPQKLKATHSVWQKRREHTRCKKTASENVNDLENSLKKTESQNVKNGLSNPLSMTESVSKQNSTTLRDLINIKNEKKINLSLNKNKLRQKRLVFEREKSVGDKISEIVEDVIDSPVVTSKAKPARNLLARKDSTEDKIVNQSNRNQIGNLTLASIKKDSKIPDDYLFDFNTTALSPFKEKSSKIPLNDTSLCLKLSLYNKSDASPSCVILTPATQDIVFVDDETDEELSDTGKDLKTMDIMADVLKPDNESLTNLKRLEIDSIKKEQRKVMKQFDVNLKKTNTIDLPKTIKHEKITQTVSSDDDVTFIDEALLAQTATGIAKKRGIDEDTEDEDADLLKEAPSKIMRHDHNMGAAIENPDNVVDSEDDELFKMPLPIIIKKEKERCEEEPTYKERFTIDCEVCEKYLDLVGDRLTDREIEAILRKCTHGRDLMNNTPDGFWNPLLLSFAEDDRRNEILVDNRFAGKKKNS